MSGAGGMSAATELSVARATRTSRIGSGLGLVALAVLVTVPFWASAGDMRTLAEALTYLALAQMWNLLAGYAGLISIGQQAFVGLGAYGLYVFGDKIGLDPFLSVFLAAVAVTIIAVPTAGLAFRLRGGYFAIGTWVIAEVFRLLVINTRELGAGNGVTVASAAQLEPATRDRGTYWFALLAGAGAVLLVYFILRSRLGLALTAIRDSEEGAQSLGVNVLRSKVIVYLIAAFGCAFTGAVIYLALLRIQPNAAFSINWTAFMIFIVVIGGIGTLEGPIIGTAIFFVLQELLVDYGTWYLVALGAVAVGVMLWAPGGIWNLITRRHDVSMFSVQRRLVPGRPRDRAERGRSPA